tara:strand:- start:55 stop:936 length:882 start_codon:yes stop_codon:yes gene_type:complete
MPRIGSREWNRQQNLRRQREAEQVVQATPVNPIFNITNEIVIEAEPMECRRDILQLREQLQNKITQIDQLKTNTKEFKKQIKALKKEIKEEETNLESVKNIIEELKEHNYLKIKERIGHEIQLITNYSYKFKLISARDAELNEEQKIKYDDWKKQGNDGIGKSCVMSGGQATDKNVVQKYINYLEALVMSNNDTLGQIAKGYNFKNFMGKYENNVEEFLRVCSEDRGNFNEIYSSPECVICNKVCENQYGNNPSPVMTKGKCCDACNEGIVIPARMGLVEVKNHDGFMVIKKK